MSLLNKIKDDRFSARKNKKAQRAKFLTTLLAEAERPGLDDGKRESTDTEVLAVVKKFVKGLKETLALQYDEQLHAELSTCMEYMPTQLDDDQLRTIIGEYINEGVDKIGIIMKMLKTNYPGSFDGKRASAIAKELTS